MVKSVQAYDCVRSMLNSVSVSKLLPGWDDNDVDKACAPWADLGHKFTFNVSSLA